MKLAREVITTQDLIRLKQLGVLNFAELARQAGMSKGELMAYTYPQNRMKFHKNLERNERLRRVLLQIKKELDAAIGVG